MSFLDEMKILGMCSAIRVTTSQLIVPTVFATSDALYVSLYLYSPGKLRFERGFLLPSGKLETPGGSLTGLSPFSSAAPIPSLRLQLLDHMHHGPVFIRLDFKAALPEDGNHPRIVARGVCHELHLVSRMPMDRSSSTSALA